MMKMHKTRMMMVKRKTTQVRKARKKLILRMIPRLMVQEEVMMVGMRMTTRMVMMMMKMMGKMKRTKTRMRKMRRLHSHQPRRESENYINRKLFPWNAFESSLVIRTDKLAAFQSKTYVALFMCQRC